MPIFVEYASSGAGAALADLKVALDAAISARDNAGKEDLYGLLYEHVEGRLAKHSPSSLVRYLRSRSVWRTHGNHKVFKTADEPCVAYVAVDRNGSLQILVLGFCYRYPGSEGAWWSGVIRPRLEDYV